MFVIRDSGFRFLDKGLGLAVQSEGFGFLVSEFGFRFPGVSD